MDKILKCGFRVKRGNAEFLAFQALGETSRESAKYAWFLVLAQTQGSLLPEEKQLLSGTMGGMHPPGAP